MWSSVVPQRSRDLLVYRRQGLLRHAGIIIRIERVEVCRPTVLRRGRTIVKVAFISANDGGRIVGSHLGCATVQRKICGRASVRKIPNSRSREACPRERAARVSVRDDPAKDMAYF